MDEHDKAIYGAMEQAAIALIMGLGGPVAADEYDCALIVWPRGGGPTYGMTLGRLKPEALVTMLRHHADSIEKGSMDERPIEGHA